MPIAMTAPILLTLCVLLGCGAASVEPSPATVQSEASAATHPGAPASGSAPETVADLSPLSVDQQVLDAVFHDLLNVAEESLLHRRGQPPETLTVVSAAPRSRIDGDQVLRFLRRDDVTTRTDIDPLRLEQAVAQLAARSSRFVAPYASTVAGVGVHPGDRPPGRDRPHVRAWLPGYTADGDLAVVRLGTIVGRHAAYLYAVLLREPHGWRVVLRSSGAHL